MNNKNREVLVLAEALERATMLLRDASEGMAEYEAALSALDAANTFCEWYSPEVSI